MYLRVLDFETTGVPTEEEKHAICEVGWSDIEDGMVLPPQSRLINPGRKMPVDALAVHHITDDDVADAPTPDIACRLLMMGKPDYFVAHNAEFERKFFRGGETPWLCTYRIAVRFWPDLESHSNSYLRYALDLPVDRDLAVPVHRAGPDAYVTAHLMARILYEMEERKVKIADMVRWSNGPPLLSTIGFGKHKGMKFIDAPSDYLRWIIDKSEMSSEIKANAKHWLKQKGET